MNTFGKMGLLCCLAAVLLAGCGDGDRDVSAVSGAEVSIEQSGETSGSASEEVSDAVTPKDYELGRQVGDGNIYIACGKNENGRPCYALEKDGRIITDFDFEDVNVLESGYVVLFRGNNIAEVRNFSGERVGDKAYRVEERKQKAKVSVVKIYVPKHEGSKVREARYALATGGKRIVDDELGDILIDCTLLNDFDFDSFEDLDDVGYFAMENDNIVEEAWSYDGKKFGYDIYRFVKRFGDNGLAVVSNRPGKGRDVRYALVSGGVETKSGLWMGGEMLTDFDFDSYNILTYNILTTGYIVLKKDGEIAEVRDADGDVYTQSAYEKISGFSVGDIYAVRTGSGKDTRYALARGGYDFGGVVREPTLLTGFDYTMVRGLNYSNNEYDVRPTLFILLEKSDGSREIRNIDGRVVLSGQFSEVVPFYGMLVVKGENGYDLYNGDGTKTGVTGFRNIFSKQIEEYRIIKTTADSGEVRYSVMYAIDGSRLLLEDYDENAVCDRYYDAILATVTELVRAVKNDDFAALRKIVADEELVGKYEALLGRYNAGDRAGVTDDPSFGLLNLRLNYYEFNGTVTASERAAFVDAQSGRAEALFTVPIYDETHPMGYSETVSLVSDGKGNFRISAVGYHLFDYPDVLYYNGQDDAD